MTPPDDDAPPGTLLAARKAPRRRLLAEQHAHRNEVAVLSVALGSVVLMALLFILAARL